MNKTKEILERELKELEDAEEILILQKKIRTLKQRRGAGRGMPPRLRSWCEPTFWENTGFDTNI